jgi:hypothetical protein
MPLTVDINDAGRRPLYSVELMFRKTDRRGRRVIGEFSRWEQSDITKEGVAWRIVRLGSKVGDVNGGMFCIRIEGVGLGMGVE